MERRQRYSIVPISALKWHFILTGSVAGFSRREGGEVYLAKQECGRLNQRGQRKKMQDKQLTGLGEDDTLKGTSPSDV